MVSHKLGGVCLGDELLSRFLFKFTMKLQSTRVRCINISIQLVFNSHEKCIEKSSINNLHRFYQSFSYKCRANVGNIISWIFWRAITSNYL